MRATVGLLNALDLEPFPKDALVGDGLDGVFIGFLASRDEEDLVGFACVFGPFREALPVYDCRSTGRGDAEATSPDLADPFASGVVRWAFCAAPLRSSSAFRFTDPRVIFVLVGVVEAVDGLGFSPVIDASKSLIGMAIMRQLRRQTERSNGWVPSMPSYIWLGLSHLVNKENPPREPV